MPPFGDLDARLLIVGMAPGLKGANRTGRPFTGDGAGHTLYPALLEAGLAKGQFDENGHDHLKLIGTRITNAVRCVPPKNKITGEESATCRQFLKSEIGSMGRLSVVLGLGLDAHKAVLTALE
ncbi:MAG: uracil-DNA glycosylase family protein, partial [Pseudomonadota bacterium]